MPPELALAADDLNASKTGDTLSTLAMYAILGAGAVVLILAFSGRKSAEG